MKYRLMNSAMMPTPGRYKFQRVSQETFVGLIQKAARAGELVSYCGYQQNADVLATLSGIPIMLSRRHAGPDMQPGDVLLIMTLDYRTDGQRKGEPVTSGQFEFGLAEYSG